MNHHRRYINWPFIWVVVGNFAIWAGIGVMLAWRG